MGAGTELGRNGRERRSSIGVCIPTSVDADVWTSHFLEVTFFFESFILGTSSTSRTFYILVPMDQVVETSSEPRNKSISVELVKASIAYMRTPTPELEVPSAGQAWILDSGSPKPWFLRGSSSPVLSCPPSWLETGSNHDSPERETVDYADDDSDGIPLEVPFSSSPPDATSSSPQSAGSQISEDLAASLTPGALADLDSTQDKLPLVNVPAEDTGSDFGHRLHHLLVALKEKEGALEMCRTDSSSSIESSDYDSSMSSSGYAWTSGQQSRQGNVYVDVPFPKSYLPYCLFLLICPCHTLFNRGGQ